MGKLKSGFLLSAFSFQLFLTLALAPSANANVYATDIRILGSTPGTPTSATVFVPCDNAVLIGYRLNEAADAGVIVEIHAEATVVRAFTNAPGSPGTLRGVNTLIWDVRNEQGQVVPFGFYTVHITAAGNGYSDWTQISDDFNAGNYVFQPRGIAVNRNSNSPDYGRIFVSNAEAGFDPESEPGDQLGILKLNADGTRVEGGVSDGGWFRAGSNSIPSKIAVSDDDYVYVNDAARGLVLRFDQSISSFSRTPFLRSDNWPNSSTTNLGGPFITGAGTNTQLWMADRNDSGSVGIRRWTVGGGTIATNDLGITIVQAGTNSDLSVAPFDVALDRSNRIYTIQSRDNSLNPADRVMRFPAYDGSGAAETNADWTIGSGDNNMRGAAGIAVDPTATYVAVAFLGSGEGSGRTSGAVKVFSAANGSDVRTLTPAPFHDHTDVAWDNVGNLYLCDNADNVWRVFSPPGANTNKTVAPQTLEVAPPPLSPYLQAVGYTNGQFLFTLCGRTNVDYVIVASTNVLASLQTWTPVLTNQDNSFLRLIAVAAPESRRFYRAFAQ